MLSFLTKYFNNEVLGNAQCVLPNLLSLIEIGNLLSGSSSNNNTIYEKKLYVAGTNNMNSEG